MGMTKRERQLLMEQTLEDMRRFDCAAKEKYISSSGEVASELAGNRSEWYIIGIDEVGRGPLAGPVVAAATVMPFDWAFLGVNDSKKLSEKKRKELSDLIKKHAVAYGIGFVNHRNIDKFNILNATKIAMAIACRKCMGMLQTKGKSGNYFLLLIDGNTKIPVDLPQETILQGDGKSLSIAASSILAKVARDEFMINFGERCPEYDFAKHKGYGTKAHYLAIEKFGLSSIHRRSFLKKILDE